MVRPRPDAPAGHGELLLDPPFEQWQTLLERNRREAATRAFTVADVPAAQFTASVRAEALQAAWDFSARMGVSVRESEGPDRPVVVTGHQPELFHPGVWAKTFLLRRIAREAGATALDIVVDSDGFDTVSMVAPCLKPVPRRCRQHLAIGVKGGCYACASVPSRTHVEEFRDAVLGTLAGLPAQAPARHFSRYAQSLLDVLPEADNLSEALTFARRRYESTADTDHLELPVTEMARTPSYLRFFFHVARKAGEFAEVHNRELAQYRSRTGTRSAAQPFPDLEADGPFGIELPFWRLHQGVRSSLHARENPSGVVEVFSGGELVCALPDDDEAAMKVLVDSGELFAPKALTLTMYTRLFLSDLFIHGVGGGRYDHITDAVIREFFGVEPPAHVVASLTMFLPLGAPVVDAQTESNLREKLHRIRHNPDTVLGEVEFDSAEERRLAYGLADEKQALVEAIAAPDADRKVLGLRIRAVNGELSALLDPVIRRVEAELTVAEAHREVSEILTDRTYPFCLWEPAEVADKVG